MADRKKRSGFDSDPERAAHDALVDEHLRMVYERADRFFAQRGQKRPTDIVAHVRARYGTSNAAAGTAS